MLTVRHATLAGFWPIPEAFRLEPGLTALPPRMPQPGLAYLPQARAGPRAAMWRLLVPSAPPAWQPKRLPGCRGACLPARVW